MSDVNANYDEPWKEALGEYFEPFLRFFFPKVHGLIDWSKQPKSLDKELQQITASSDSGLRIVDKLFQVWRADNQEIWILVHIEVQSQEESEFSKRMYIYNYRAFDPNHPRLHLAEHRTQELTVPVIFIKRPVR